MSASIRSGEAGLGNRPRAPGLLGRLRSWVRALRPPHITSVAHANLAGGSLSLVTDDQANQDGGRSTEGEHVPRSQLDRIADHAKTQTKDEAGS
jgi:hypothetical protein